MKHLIADMQWKRRLWCRGDGYLASEGMQLLVRFVADEYEF